MADKTVLTVNLRPTLVIGLGGTGLKIITQLKARMEEQFGQGSNYNNVIKFLCFDTARENYSAPQPNYPDRKPVSLSESEFVRISDIPLQDLRYIQDENPAMRTIFPDVLYSTQIDQGAQQVRRLGRIALFYHYQNNIKGVLKQNLDAIRNIANKGNLGQSEDGHRELFVKDLNSVRIFIVCSICGGTGSGTFIDIAYLARHLSGIDPRSLDVIGMLLLPEAFPDIRTTGESRIRANAYAALLDMEYYNQATGLDRHLYQVDMPNEHIQVDGSPFSLCYLVGSSNLKARVGDITVLAPILAEALDTMISTRIGEQLDATLDNIRPTLTNYRKGFRAFYSALGISQIVFPRPVLEQRFMTLMKQRLIDYWLSDKDKNSNPKLYWDENDDPLAEYTSSIQQPLRNLREEAFDSFDPLADFQNAFFATREQYDQAREKIIDEIPNKVAQMVKVLERDIIADIDQRDMGFGLRYVMDWLDELYNSIKREIDELYRLPQTSDIQRTFRTQMAHITNARMPFFSKRRLRTACSTMINAFEKDKENNILPLIKRKTLEDFQETVERFRNDVALAIEFWREVRDDTSGYIQALAYSPVTDPVFDRTEQEHFVANAVADAMDTDGINQIHQSILRHLKAQIIDTSDNEETIRSLSRSLNPAEHPALRKILDDFIRNFYRINVEYDKSDVLKILGVIESSTMATVTSNEDSPQFSGKKGEEWLQGLLLDYDRDFYSSDETILRADAREILAVLEERRRIERKNRDIDDPSKSGLNNRLSKLAENSSPLLVYKPGLLNAMPPRTIRIIGAETADGAAKVRDSGAIDKADINIVETGDPTRLIFLYTQHGIPANTLEHFDDYRKKYEAEQSQPNPIFHLDNIREREPHDPASENFVNLNDFETIFAQALAYEWIIPGNANIDAYRLRKDFYDIFKYVVEEEIKQLRGKARMKNDDYSDIRRQILESMAHNLENEFARFEDDQSSRPEVTGYPIPSSFATTEHKRKRAYARTLRDAITSLYGQQSRQIANMFRLAFEQHVKDFDQATDLNRKIRKFLGDRNYITSNNHDSVSLRLSDYNDPDSRDLEIRFCQLLTVYLRLQQAKQNSKRWSAGYYQEYFESQIFNSGEDTE